jgi:hypothetical protein
MPDQILGVYMTILATRLQIGRDRGCWARLMQQLKRLNTAIKMLQGVQGALRTAAGGVRGDNDGDVRVVGNTPIGGGMENLKESVRRTVDGHEELGAWNSRAVEAIRILDRVKINQEGSGNDLLFVFYLHMGMCEIHWREEGDPMIERIYKMEIYIYIFYVRGIVFSTFFFGACFFLLWYVVHTKS